MIEIVLGFILGIIASGIAAVVYEYASRPLLMTMLDDSGRARGQVPNNPPHEFYHLKVRNLPAKWPIPGRKPAWSCKAIIEVFNINGSLAIQDRITARWTTQPEPLLPTVMGNTYGNLIDPARMVAARKVDVHSHEDQQISLAIKFEGSPECHIFSNESYLFPRWQNPAWSLGVGTYRVRVTVYYERGRSQNDFEFRNLGPSCEDMYIGEWLKT